MAGSKQKARNLLCLIYWLFFFPNSLNGQLISIRNGESTAAFIERIKPFTDAKPLEKFYKLSYQSASDSMIIAFYRYADSTNELYTYCYGFLAVGRSKSEYKMFFVDRYGQEGANPEPQAIGFVNTNHDRLKDIAIILGWQQSHDGIYGTLYKVFLYDNLGYTGSIPNGFQASKINILFKHEFDGITFGEKKKAKYKYINNVKFYLNRLGYEQ